MSNLFEAKVGEGKLVFSSIDLSNNLNERPVARQLCSSLLQYMSSSDFNPAKSIQLSDLKVLAGEANDKQFDDFDIYED